MDALLQYDYAIFKFINSTLQNDFFDWIMPLWRSKYLWFPLYVYLLALLWNHFKNKFWIIIIGVILMMTISDAVSSHLIKKNIKRKRPCRTEIIKNDVHLLVPCSWGYSFTSSHATNHFTLAMFLFVLLGAKFKKLRYTLLFWAESIGFGQIYVGVHFPIDVIVGSLLGILIGGVVGLLVKKKVDNSLVF